MQIYQICVQLQMKVMIVIPFYLSVYYDFKINTKIYFSLQLSHTHIALTLNQNVSKKVLHKQLYTLHYILQRNSLHYLLPLDNYTNSI